jgi:hypothetical protein
MYRLLEIANPFSQCNAQGELHGVDGYTQIIEIAEQSAGNFLQAIQQ